MAIFCAEKKMITVTLLTPNNSPLLPKTVQDIELYILTEICFWFYSFSQEWLFNKTL